MAASESTSPIENFNQRAAEFSRLIDRELLKYITTGEQVPNLHDGVIYSLGLDSEDPLIRGKRIRPTLCLMTVEALGGAPTHAIPFACAIEMLHNFALVHDDIQDGDSQRRGRPCTYRKFGLAHGINIGDFMLSRVYTIQCRDPHNSLPVREQLLELLHRTLEHIFIGQSLDISARESRHFTLADYERLVAMKTGSYLVAPILGGAIIAGAEEDTIEAITRYGRAVGPLFQVKDDLIDLTTGKGRGEIGSDIREGKRSYLVAAALETCTPEESIRLYDILDRPRDSNSAEEVKWAVELFHRTGAVEKAEAFCEKLRVRAMAAIENAPPALRDFLQVAAEVLTQRKN